MSKLAYPKGRLLLVRDCTVDICLKNNPGAVLLSVLLFWYDNPHKGDWYNEGLHEFCMCRTQAEIEEASCHQIDVKTIHDTAIPLLRLLGYLHVGKKMNGDLYILHMDRVIAAFAAYEQSCKQHDPAILKNHIRSLLQLEPALIEMTEFELESALINKSRLYLLLERTLIRIRADSNCKRGPKTRVQRAAEAVSENIETIRDSIEIDTKREGDAFAPLSPLPLEDETEEDEGTSPTRYRIPAVKLNGQQTPGTPALPSAADPLSGSHGITSDQAHSPAREVSYPPTTQGSHEHHDAAATSGTGEPRASGERAKPEKPVQQALNSEAEGKPKETAAQKKRRIAKRQDEIIALHCQLLGRNVVRSKDELEGARLMAEAGSSDAEIELTYSTYKDHKFWGPQLTLKTIAKLLDTTVQREPIATKKPAKAPGTSDFDIYKGNGPEERAALLAHYEELKASGELLI